MQIFAVGGAVRDALLGEEIKDRDWVVTGATPEQMHQHGFLPVGKDFPIFLHPETHEEYALARTERKQGHGYHGFHFNTSPHITLEQDLKRRDLTINAIAQSADGTLIDPYGGQHDIQQRILRHVSEAFAEDPVRILRIARFNARFADFTIAPETQQLMVQMVENGEVDHLVAERSWQEISRGLMEKTPLKMLKVLHDCGALARIAPALETIYHSDADAALAPLHHSAQAGQPLTIRWACLLTALLATAPTSADTAITQAQTLCAAFKVPNELREPALLLLREYPILTAPPASAEAIAGLLQRCDAYRRTQRFTSILQNLHHTNPQQGVQLNQFWLTALTAAQQVDTATIAQSVSQKQQIGEQIYRARTQAITAAIHNNTATS